MRNTPTFSLKTDGRLDARKLILLFIIGFFSHSCTPSSSSEVEKSHYLSEAERIATDAQKALLGEVSAQMKAGGAVQAVRYCNEKAIELTDSLAHSYPVEIQRLSDRNRNPNNAIFTDRDTRAWQYILAQYDVKKTSDAVLFEDEDNVYYYKAILVGMPACLACHGDPTQDIAPETLSVISSHYPQDKATGYTQGALRGMWKITMKK